MTTTPQTPLISIIVPTYNRAGYIGETIQSIRQQIYQHWELIVVDDGSNDNTEDIITAIKDNRIRFYKAGRTGNIIRLRLKGIAVATGELLAFMDSDDLWAPEKLQKQVDAFWAYPDAGFSLTGGYNFRTKNEPLAFFYRQKEGLLYGHLLTAFFKSEVAMIFPTLVLRSRYLQKMKEEKQIDFDSDVDFLIALATHFTGVVLYEPLLYRRLHDSNASGSDWEKGYTDKIVVIQSTKAKRIISAALANEALFKLYINYGEKHLLFQQQRKAVQRFWKAWQNRPFSIVPLKKTGKAVLSLFRHK